MAITLKTISGKIVVPGTTTGIRADVTATPMTTASALTFPADDTISWGPVTGRTNGSGQLPASFKIPTSQAETAVMWKITATPADRHPGLPKSWTLGYYEITGTGTVDLADMVEIDVTVINPATLVTVQSLVTAAEAAATTATTKATEASGSAAAALSSAADADSSADLAAASETNAAGSASTATTKAGEAATSATAAAGSATSASGSATAAANSATAAQTAETNAETAETAAQGYAASAAGSVSLVAWAPATAYAAGDVRQAPDGTAIARISNGTSRPSFDATEEALWEAALTKTGTVAQRALTATFAVVNEAPLSPTRYGAVLDGTTDDTTAWQDTLNALPAAGGEIYFRGETKTTAQLTAAAPLRLRGAGPDRSRIVCTAIGSAVDGIQTTESLDIEGLEVSMDVALVANQSQKAVNNQDGTAGQHMSVRNFRSRGFNTGIYASGNVDGSDQLDYVTVEDADIQISGGAAGGISSPVVAHRTRLVNILGSYFDSNGVGDHGAYLIGNEHLNVKGNLFRGAPTFGIKAVTEAGMTALTDFGLWVIEDNEVRNASSGVVVLLQGANHRLRSLVLDNDIEDISNALGSANAAVLVSLATATSSLDFVRLAGRIYDCQVTGALFDGAAGGRYRSTCLDDLFIGKFSQASSGVNSGFVTGTNPTHDMVSVGRYDVDGESTGRNGLNLNSAARVSVGPTYSRRNCTTVDVGVKLGFFGGVGVAKPAAITQTYSTATRTHAALTATAAAGAAPTKAEFDALLADLTNVKQVLNSLIDDQQGYGLV